MKKENRIKKNEEFKSIISKRRCVRSTKYTIFYDDKKLDHSRVGISVSKKLGNSPQRNKIKRQIRMMFIQNYDYLNNPYDLIVIVRSDFVLDNYQNNQNDLEKLINKVIIK